MARRRAHHEGTRLSCCGTRTLPWNRTQFQLAGAKSVIASLWTADDTYTIALMKRLYRGFFHLKSGGRLKTAQRRVRIHGCKERHDGCSGEMGAVWWFLHPRRNSILLFRM